MLLMKRPTDECQTMTKPEIARRRLHSQRLIAPAFENPLEVVRWFGAVQAQEYLASLWALANRLPETTEADIEQAVAERRILRTWPMRGTVHFIPAEDTRWMVELMAKRVMSRFKSHHRQLGLDEAVFAQARTIFERALRDGQALPRKVLYERLQAAGIETGAMRGVFIAGKLAHEGLICMGPRFGKQPSFAWLDAYAPEQRTLSHMEAIVEMTWRYFRSHGPATLQDFVWWSGLRVTEARAGLDALRDTLVTETVDGKTYWWVDDPPLASADDTVVVLPPFDEYLVSYTDRTASLDPQFDGQWPWGGALGSSIIVIGGQVVGYWQRHIRKQRVSVEAKTFRRLDHAEQVGFEAALARYGAFLGLPVELV